MEEIKVGEHIRDCVSGEIGKVVEVNQNYYRKEDGFKIWRASFKKIKHSSNIIDLIEEGDYVNGYKVSFIAQDCAKFVQCDYPVETGATNHYKFYKESIKDVVTKQQFNQTKYIVGDERNVKD